MDSLLDLQWLEKGDISFVSFYGYYALVMLFVSIIVSCDGLGS